MSREKKGAEGGHEAAGVKSEVAEAMARAKQWQSDEDAGLVDDVLKRKPGYRYYVVDLKVPKVRIASLRQRLHGRGYSLCRDAGDDASAPTINLAELWRIPEEVYQVHWQARKDKDDALRAALAK